MVKDLIWRIKGKNDSRQATRTFAKDMDMAAGKIAVVDRNMAQFATSMMSTANMLRGGIFVAGITAGVAAINNAAQSVADLASQAETAGVGFEAFQELKFVADEKRVGIDALTDGMKELNLRADEFIVTKAGPAKEAFERIGYTADELAVKLKDPEVLLGEIIGRLGDLETAAQIRVADEIFGGTAGEQFVRLIDEGEEGIADMRDRAHELGLVLDEEAAVAAKEVARTFDLLMQRWDTWWKGGALDAIMYLQDPLRDYPGMTVDKLNSMSRDQLVKQFGENGANSAGYARALDVLTSKLRAGERSDPLSGFGNIYASDIGTGGFAFSDLTAFEQNHIAGGPPTRPKGLKGKGREAWMRSRRTEISEYEKVMQALQHEATLIGKTKQEQEILNRIRQAGVGVMSAEADQIRAQIEANDAMTQSIEAQQAAHEELQRQIQGMTDVAMSHFDRLIDGTENFGDAVLGTIEDIAKAWLRQQAQQGPNALFGGIFNIFGGGGPLGIGARANGGLVQANQPYLVGERGPELIVPRQQGIVVPNHKMQSGSGEIVNFNIDVSGANGDEAIHQIVASAVSAGLEQYDKGTPRRVANAIRQNKLMRVGM